MRFFFTNIFAIILAILTIGFSQPSFAQEEGEVEPTVDNLFVRFQPISVSIVRDFKVQGQLSVTLYLGLNKASTEDVIENLRPKIRDSLLNSLTRVANTRVNPYRPVDIDLIVIFMQTGLDELLGEGVAEVLIQSAAAQPS